MVEPVTIVIVCGIVATLGSLIVTVIKFFSTKNKSYKIKVDDEELEVSANQLTKDQIGTIIQKIDPNYTYPPEGGDDE